jgi:hypothetical protein
VLSSARLARVMRLVLLAGMAPLLVAALPATAAPPSSAQAGGCGASQPSNGTGYGPPSKPSSLPSETARPGPELLYRKLATSPQLENTGPWRAAPIMVSGVRGYRAGEFVYQDFLYDDTALAYPADPANAGNAADLVEVRLKLLPDGLGVRLTYNSMIKPDLVAATIALGASTAAHPLPHGARATSRGQVFVTVHGCTGDAVRASGGAGLGAVGVTTDLRRRQVDVRIPYRVYDPRSLRSFEVRAAAGLWNAAARSYQTYQGADALKPAFFNVAFRQPGAYTGNTWMDESQNAALTAGDISPLFAKVEVAKLTSGRRDDLLGQPGGMPRKGPMNRILVSHFEPQQGRGKSDAGNNDKMCRPPDCTYLYSGRLQPYTLVIPDRPAPRTGYRLAVNLHGSGENHNANENNVLGLLANVGPPTIVVSPLGRGPSFWWFELGAADVYEAWADAAARYQLDPRFVLQTGQSMGGYGTYKLASTFPDLYTGAFASVGPGAPTADLVPGASPVTPRSSDVWKMFASLRHVPVVAMNSATDVIVPITTSTNNLRTLEDLHYRHHFNMVVGSPHSDHRPLLPEEAAALARSAPVNRNPRRVTYVVNTTVSNPELGVVADHAYWVSQLRLADAKAVFGQVDVVSRAFPTGDPDTGTQELTPGVALGGPWPYVRFSRDWGAAPAARPSDVLDITATNVRSLTVDVGRARLSCHPKINITSDVPLKVHLVGGGCAKASATATATKGAPRATSASPPGTSSQHARQRQPAKGPDGKGDVAVSAGVRHPVTGPEAWAGTSGLALIAGAALLGRHRRAGQPTASRSSRGVRS